MGKEGTKAGKIIKIILLSFVGLIVLLFLIGFFIGLFSSNEDIKKQIEQSVVLVKYQYAEKTTEGVYSESGASGSGVLFYEDNENYYILTNRHVVDCGYWEVEEMCWEKLWEKVQVRTQDGKFHNISSVSYFPHNLDVVQLEFKKEVGDNYPLLEYLSESYNGESVIAVGYPTFSDKTLEFSISEGYITGFRTLLTEDGFSFKVIDSDAYTNFGSSGGGLFDTEGNLLGINTWIDEYNGYAIDYYFLSGIINETFYCEEDAYIESDECIERCAEDEMRSIRDGLCYKEASKECDDDRYYCEKGYYCYKDQCVQCPTIDTYLFLDGECYYKGTKEKPYG